MITNPLLETKYETQKKLAQRTNRDLRKYIEIYRRTRVEIEKKYSLKFRYATNLLEKSSPEQDATN